MDDYESEVEFIDRVLTNIKSDAKLSICPSIYLDNNLILVVIGKCVDCKFCALIDQNKFINDHKCQE